MAHPAAQLRQAQVRAAVRILTLAMRRSPLKPDAEGRPGAPVRARAALDVPLVERRTKLQSPSDKDGLAQRSQIGRASCRERVSLNV